MCFFESTTGNFIQLKPDPNFEHKIKNTRINSLLIHKNIVKFKSSR